MYMFTVSVTLFFAWLSLFALMLDVYDNLMIMFHVLTTTNGRSRTSPSHVGEAQQDATRNNSNMRSSVARTATFCQPRSGSVGSSPRPRAGGNSSTDSGPRRCVVASLQYAAGGAASLRRCLVETAIGQPWPQPPIISLFLVSNPGPPPNPWSRDNPDPGRPEPGPIPG